MWKGTGKLQIHFISKSAIYIAKKSYIFQFTMNSVGSALCLELEVGPITPISWFGGQRPVLD